MITHKYRLRGAKLIAAMVQKWDGLELQYVNLRRPFHAKFLNQINGHRTLKI